MRPSPLLARQGLETVAAVLIYTAFAVFLTWPLVIHLGSSVYLYPANPPAPGDLAGSVAHLRELVEGHHNPFLPGRVHDFDAPGGLPIRWALNLSSFPSVLLLYGLAIPFGATAAFGLFVLLGYIATGLAMFLLVRRLTGSVAIGLIAGWAFAFFPFEVVNGEHSPFVHGWVFVLMAWRFLRLMDEPTPLNGVWAGLASVLALAWTQYFILLGGVAYWTLTLAALAIGAARRRLRHDLVAHLPSLLIVVGFVLSMRWLLLRTNEDATLPGNTLRDVVATGAHLPMFVVPPGHHPLSAFSVSYLNAHGWNGVEWTLYVGLSVLALAVVGLSAAILRLLPPPLTRVAGVFAVLTCVAILFSLPPEVHLGGSIVRMPSWLIFHASPNWRLYTRFVVVVMLGLCLLAALGMHALTRGQPTRLRAVVLGACALLVPLDLWDRPPERTFDFQTPAIYRVLRAQPPGIAAEYPLRPIGNTGDYLDLYYQGRHGKPIINGYLSGPDEQRALALASLDDPSTAGRLATIGVRYVLITPFRFAYGVPDPGRPKRGFRLLAKDSYGLLYRVTVRPIPFVYARSGLEPPEGPEGRQFRWASSSPVELEVIAPCSDCQGELRFRAASFAEPRLLRVTDGTGRELVRHKVIRTDPAPVTIPISFDRNIVLKLFLSPGAKSIHDVTGQPDPRTVSIWVMDPHFVPNH